MFTNARLFIKTAFIFFIIGILSGLYLYGAKAFQWPVPYTLVSAHTHVLLMGGVYMMILGVAVWFFPRPPKDDQKYNPVLVLWFYWIFTGATGGRFVIEIIQGIYKNPIWITAGFLSAVLQVIASVGLVYSVWGRIRAVGSKIRESKGERF
ncbi:MAG: hypothetical protein K9M49_03450 [Candidatus Marinimicrobia bacterium]|nr:hypothetical protein [Candidatus Neomarinimicrobiota bacterium]MCF7904190.1 hypothetical protein [Candidatus Neomarinimicrobiota bacterium]